MILQLLSVIALLSYHYESQHEPIFHWLQDPLVVLQILQPKQF